MKLKKIISIFTVALLCISFSTTAFATDGASLEQRSSVYAVNIYDSEWSSFETYDEMVASCDIPDETLAVMSTDELVRAVLDYPLLVNLFLFNTYEQGIESVRQGSDAFCELIKRNDSADLLFASFNQANTNTRNTTNFSFEQMALAILLTNDDLFFALSQDAQSQLEEHFTSVNMNLVVDSSYENKTDVKSNVLTAPRASVTTPKGSSVSVISFAEGPAPLLNDLNTQTIAAYPKATYVSSASLRYNCHSYAWYSTSTSNPYWINNPSIYMTDGSYTRDYSYINCIGSRMYFPYGDHSAIVNLTAGPIIEAGLINLGVISKWGDGPVMSHKAGYGPYNTSGLTLWK